MTPEGEVKAKTTALLKEYGAHLWYYMPVPFGYGESSLDYLCCYYGVFFAIEAKAPGKKPTTRQRIKIADMEAAGGRVFVVDGAASLQKVKEWLDDAPHLKQQNCG